MPYDFINRLEKIPDSRIRGVVNEIPVEWINRLRVAAHGTEARNVITEKLLNKKRRGLALRARLDLLRMLKAETTEEARLRSLVNKKAFEQKYGRL